MTDRPQDDELEIVVFGAGVGECLLIHVGAGTWIVVDSTVDPADERERPVALAYLEALGYEPVEAVSLIVVTHWHDDHVAGLSELVTACQNAQLCWSSAMSPPEALAMLSYAERGDRLSAPMQQMASVVRQLTERARVEGVRVPRPLWAMEGRGLIERSVAGSVVRLTSMTPSDETKTRAALAIASALPQVGERIRMRAPSPNHTSVVLWLQRNEDSALLGADLEVSRSRYSGWQPIVRFANDRGWTAEFFKVPHHGADNGHENDVWTTVLEPHPFAVLTPYARGAKFRPSKEDQQRICDLTPRAFQAGALAPPEEDSELLGTLLRGGYEVDAATGRLGLVRARKRVGSEWDVTCIGNAGALTSG